MSKYLKFLNSLTYAVRIPRYYCLLILPQSDITSSTALGGIWFIRKQIKKRERMILKIKQMNLISFLFSRNTFPLA